jgi:hypothetical protein
VALRRTWRSEGCEIGLWSLPSSCCTWQGTGSHHHERQEGERDLPIHRFAVVDRTARRVVRAEGRLSRVDAVSSCGHHDSTELNRAVIAKLVRAMPAKVTGIGQVRCLYCTTLDFVIHELL